MAIPSFVSERRSKITKMLKFTKKKTKQGQTVQKNGFFAKKDTTSCRRRNMLAGLADFATLKTLI